MAALVIILLVLALVFALVATVIGYAGQAPGQPVGWRGTNFLALAIALYLLVQLLVALGVVGRV